MALKSAMASEIFNCWGHTASQLRQIGTLQSLKIFVHHKSSKGQAELGLGIFGICRGLGKIQSLHPGGNGILGCAAAEALAVQPLGVFRQFLQTVGTGADAAGAGGAEGDDSGIAEVTALQEGVDHLSFHSTSCSFCVFRISWRR